jgi:hypothetical protein
MLEIIGRSKDAISSYQIKNGLKGSGNTYIYDMVEELLPTKRSVGKYLFSWNDLPGTLEYRRKLFEKLDKIYGLKWLGSHKTYEDSERELLQYELLKFEKSDDNKLLTISHDSNQIDIGISETESNTAYMFIHTGTKETIKVTLVTQRNSGKLQVHVAENTPTPIRYLDSTINEKGQKLITEIKNHMRDIDCNVSENDLETSKEVLKIQNDRHYWKYSLNVRGFILYLLGLTKTEKKKLNKKEVQGVRQDERKRGRKKGDMSYNTRRIDKTLEIISDNHLEVFPFLSNYRTFREVLPKNHLIDLVREVAEELQFQLDTTDIRFLK